MILAGRCGGHRRRVRPFLAIGREQLLPPSAAKQNLPKEVPCFPGRGKELGGREPCGGAEGPFPAAAAAAPARLSRLRREGSAPRQAGQPRWPGHSGQRCPLAVPCSQGSQRGTGHRALHSQWAGLQKHHTDPCITRGTARAEWHKSCFVPSARL